MKSRLLRIPFILSLLFFALLLGDIALLTPPPGRRGGKNRWEARILKLRGKKLQQEGKDKLREGKIPA